MDVLLALVALGLLVVVGLSLWRRVKALGREVARAGALVAEATAQLEQQQQAPSRTGAAAATRGVPSHLSS